jgi:hypothetical protein
MTVASSHRDPAVAATAFVLWALLGLFVIYPLAMLLGRVLFDHGRTALIRTAPRGADRQAPDQRILE